MSNLRPIRRLLVANRGEIATRLINAVREYDPSIEVFALVSPFDTTHGLCLPSSHVLTLTSAADYLNVSILLSIIQRHHIDTVHPGYGFLSESAEFARRAWEEAGALVIGPGWDILEKTGDKLAARNLAEECQVPVLSGMKEPTDDIELVKGFAQHCGLPVMVKAVDGGGGRGIRLIRIWDELESSTRRALQESPSKRVFVEKAAIEGFRHVEVQVIGDRFGNVYHLWERECSIQRRHQKIVEMAPSSIRGQAGGDQLVARVINAAVRMAKRINYVSLGTFEFLVSPHSTEYFFLEINPRLQVEHTITEQISQVDIVALQLAVAKGKSLRELLSAFPQNNSQIAEAGLEPHSPSLKSIQLRLTAEDPTQSFSLSIGTVTSFCFPSGHGIRVDTSLTAGHDSEVSAEFDSLLAKIIVTGTTWNEAMNRAKRALEDTHIDGVKTNLNLLRAIVASHDFRGRQCDTRWLESNLDGLIQEGGRISDALSARDFAKVNSTAHATTMTGMSSSSVLFRKGDTWQINLSPESGQQGDQTHQVKLAKVMRNEFPSLLLADIEYFAPDSDEPQNYHLDASAVSQFVTNSALSQRRGEPSNKGHIVLPFPGILVEVLVDQGDFVQPEQVVCVVKQMKMELEVRTKHDQRGFVTWVTDVEDGGQVSEGMLVAEIDCKETIEAKL